MESHAKLSRSLAPAAEKSGRSQSSDARPPRASISRSIRCAAGGRQMQEAALRDAARKVEKNHNRIGLLQLSLRPGSRRTTVVGPQDSDGDRCHRTQYSRPRKRREGKTAQLSRSALADRARVRSAASAGAPGGMTALSCPSSTRCKGRSGAKLLKFSFSEAVFAIAAQLPGQPQPISCWAGALYTVAY